MQAQHQNSDLHARDAQAARLLLQANIAYADSNSSESSLVQRLNARQECRGHLEQALAVDPESAGALGLLGRVELDDGQLEKAQLLFNASLNADPEQPQQYANLGYWALKSERPALAEQYFLQALDYDRQSASAFCGVAHAKRLQGQFDVAYLHYRKLLEMGVEWASVYSGMLNCALHLNVDRADGDLAQDAIALLRQEGLPHQELGRFVGAIIHQQYDLDNPSAEIILDAASEDELLILALQKTLMPSPAIENLVVLLRRAIVAEVAQTVELRDDLQRLALAIGQYVDRTGYALIAEEDEERLVAAINDSIQAQLVMAEPQDGMIGSLIISSMYGALFHQAFAVQLGQWSLTDWPLALQPVLAASYYDRANEEAIKQNFAEKADELALEKTDTPQAWPAWSQLAFRAESSLKSLMATELKLPTDHLPNILRIMICGAQSGQRAMELARYLSDVEIIAVDESLANIAKGTRMAGELGMENIVFWPWSIAQQFVADGHQVHWIEIGRLPSSAMTNLSLAALVNDATSSGAVVHMHTTVAEQTRGDQHIRSLIEEHNLKPNRATLRQLRQMVLTSHQDTDWQELANEDDFFNLGGCRDRWFCPQETSQLRQLMGMVSNEVEWKLVKARDTDGHSLATQPVQKQIQAEALGSEVQSLVGQGLSVYFCKRR
ncbi:tetratricopeptide repeat protein [Marinobacter sp. F4206]|uniref:tetratricopeptide repeat protein n=1 Tax=Marinobacter sp. F4206 TaxID=2861777 RepID=UPI001C5CF807|nr:tetratricopeptide repeat protein [Marinobacter sp. F4206]MBW4933765.1 tetratricopeptide repeat protein [Marinobacter sp. F4206]